MAQKSRTIKVWKRIEGAEVTGITDKVFEPGGVTQSPSVVLDGKTLTEGEDYDLSYENCDKVSSDYSKPKVTITGKGFYKGTITSAFSILPKGIEGAVISQIPDKVYTGDALYPWPASVILDGTSLYHSDYTCNRGDYTNNTGVGTASFLLKGIGNYTGQVRCSFRIIPRDISEATVSNINDYSYTGSDITQSPVVSYNGKALSLGTDFSVSYKNNREIGTAEITITGKGNFKGSVKKAFVISEEPVVGTSTSIVSPQKSIVYEPGKEILIKAKANKFAYTYMAGTPVKVNGPDGKETDYPNFIFIRVMKGSEEVLYTAEPYYNGTDFSVEHYFTPPQEGQYQIQVTWYQQTFYYDSDGKWKKTTLESKDFVPDASLTIKVEKKNEEQGESGGTGGSSQGGSSGSGSGSGSGNSAEDGGNAAGSNTSGQDGAATDQNAGADEEDAKNGVSVQKIAKATENRNVNTIAADPKASIETSAYKDLTSGKAKVTGKVISSYSFMQLKAGKPAKKAVRIKWRKAGGIKKYLVYGGKAGGKIKFLGETGSNRFTHKGLKNGKYYKYQVLAIGAGNTLVAVSKPIFVSVKGGKSGDPVKVAVKKSRIRIKKGKRVKLRASIRKPSGKKIKKYRKLAYESSRPDIVKVSKNGKVKALKKGKAVIYVYAQNGLCKKVKVTVK